MAQYSIVTPPVGGVLSLATLKAFLRIDASNTSEDALLTMFMSSVQSTFERYAGLVLQPTTFKLITTAPQIQTVVTIAKSPVTSFTSVKIWDGTAFVVTDYEGVDGYNAHVHISGSTLSDTLHDKCEIIFIAGLTTIPEDLKLAMYQHCAYVYENRGDCPIESGAFPSQVKDVYNSYKVLWI